MFSWIEKFRQMPSKTRWFYLQFWVYMLIMIATWIFAYARLDFVRSYDTQERQIYKQDLKDYPQQKENHD